VLSINQLEKYYYGHDGNALTVLDRVSLDVPDEQFLSILGPSGCGKTTLIRIVAGITESDGGSFSIDGAVKDGPGFDRAVVFQSYGLLPWRTVLGNVELGLEIQGISRQERRELARHYLEVVGLADSQSAYPSQLSGGMQQRVGLARALAKKPAVLLMDEPFAAVDMQTREILQEQLLRIWQENRTIVLFVTHSIEEAVFLGDRVIVMGARPGRIVEDIAIDLDRPRDSVHLRGLGRFRELSEHLRDSLRVGHTLTGPVTASG
jgi:ABC-type nitrate/sulfonate/bicarbonate transport system ATPase subunit